MQEYTSRNYQIPLFKDLFAIDHQQYPLLSRAKLANLVFIY